MGRRKSSALSTDDEKVQDLNAHGSAENDIDAKVKDMMSHYSAWAYIMLSKPEMEGAAFKWRDPDSFYQYYQSLDKDDKRKIALQELAQKGLSATTDKVTVNNAISEAILVATNGVPHTPATEEEVKHDTRNQGTGADMKVQYIDAKKDEASAVESARQDNETINKANMTADQRIDACMDLAVYSIAQYESFISNAKMDEGSPAVAFGNHKHPDGTPVKMGDTVTSVEQAMPYISAHINNDERAYMIQHLPITKMTDAEIVAMTSLLYNTGAGVLTDKKHHGKSLGQLATAYFNNRDDKKAKKAFEDAFTSYNRGRVSGYLEDLDKRRHVEWGILTGQIEITIDDDVKSHDNVINIKHNSRVYYKIGGKMLQHVSSNDLQAYVNRNINDNVSDCIELMIDTDLELAARKRTPAKKTTPPKRVRGR